MDSKTTLNAQGKNLSTGEWVTYLMAIFFYTSMTGVVGGYRQSYLVNILLLPSSVVSMYNAFLGIAGFVLSFIYAMIIDNKRNSGKGKFRPLGLITAVPCGLLTVLMFVSPSQLHSFLLFDYLVVIGLLQHAAFYFGNSMNMVAVVMTPNNRERDKLLSFRGISSAIGNSAYLVIAIVVGAIIKKSYGFDNDQLMYVITAGICAVMGTITMLLGMKTIKERTAYTKKRENPLLGYKDILSDKYAIIVMISEFLKSFRGIATYMGVFLAVALLGSTSKYILFGLPTGVGTFVGMLIINALLKKFNSKQLYIASGIFSVAANCGAFAVGWLFFKNPDSIVCEIVFFIFLFLIGLQFGASNLLPSMFQADILEDLEYKTGKRLDASLPFVIGIGSTISGLIASTAAPKILYGSSSIIQYVQPIIDAQGNKIYQPQELRTKLLLLFFYTVFHGLMMLLAGVPFFFYKLTGTTKSEMHDALLKKRALIAQAESGDEDTAATDTGTAADGSGTDAPSDGDGK